MCVRMSEKQHDKEMVFVVSRSERVRVRVYERWREGQAANAVCGVRCGRKERDELCCAAVQSSIERVFMHASRVVASCVGAASLHWTRR